MPHTVERIDEYENWAVIIFTLQLPTVCRVGLRTLVLGSLGSAHQSLSIAIPILGIEAAYGFKLFRHMRALQGRRSCLGGWHTAISDARLRVRLRYLVAKYADHAPYWQFVLFARQLSLIGISAAFEPFDSKLMVLLEAAATVAILTATLMLHWRSWPYAYHHQNVAEGVLSIFSILAVVVSSVHFSLSAMTRGVSPSFAIFEALLVGMLLGPVCIFGVWLAGGGQRRVIRAIEMREALLAAGSAGDGGHA